MRRSVDLGQLFNIVVFLSALAALVFGLLSSCLAPYYGYKMAAVTPDVMSISKQEKGRKRER